MRHLHTHFRFRSSFLILILSFRFLAISQHFAVQELLKTELKRLKEDFKQTCKMMAFDGKLLGVETSDGLKGNTNWNSLSSETRDRLCRVLELRPGDYLWLAFGDRDKAVSRSTSGEVRLEKKDASFGSAKLAELASSRSVMHTFSSSEKRADLFSRKD